MAEFGIVDLTADTEYRVCPDGGVCYHSCRAGCFRVIQCAPFTNVYPGDMWPHWLMEVMAREIERWQQAFSKSKTPWHLEARAVKCENCDTRYAVNWARWCAPCSLQAELRTALEQAAKIPQLEQDLWDAIGREGLNGDEFKEWAEKGPPPWWGGH